VRRLGVGALAAVVTTLVLSAAPAQGAPAQWFGYNEVYLNPFPGDPARVADQNRLVRDSRDSGANAARFYISWAHAEPDRGEFRWQIYDAAYQKLLDAGIRPVIIDLDAPCWARSVQPFARDPFSGQPHRTARPDAAHNQDYNNFLVTVTRRYQWALAIEIWNEPNTDEYWGTQANPYEYAQLVYYGFWAVKHANPNMPVLAAGLNPNVANENGDVAPKRFLRGFYDSQVPTGRVRDLFDGLSVHPYPAQGASNVVTSAITRYEDMRNIATDYGDNAWMAVTEVGLTTSEGYYPNDPVTELNQGFRLVAIEDALQARGAVIFLIHRLRDSPGSDPLDKGAGLTRANGERKPGFCVVAARRTDRCKSSARDQAIAGDWNNDGKNTIGVFHGGAEGWYLRNSNSQGPHDIHVPNFGYSSDQAVVGDWNGDGKDTIGVFRPGEEGWYLRNSNSQGPHDIHVPFFGYGV
jgi:hypothetical protein